MVERRDHPFREGAIERAEVGAETGDRIDLAADRDLTGVRMPVPVRVRAGAEDLTVPRIVPLGPPVAMGGGEGDGAGQRGAHRGVSGRRSG